jgi:elongation factor 2
METVTSTSSQVCLAKSANKHNRIYATAEPLGEEFCKALDLKEFTPKDEPKELARKLVDDYSWDINDAKKIWCFGPDEVGCNVLVDQTKGV